MIINKIRKLLIEKVMDSELDILKNFGMDTPHFMLDRLKNKLNKLGYNLNIVKEDRDNFFAELYIKNNKVKSVKLSKMDVVTDNIDIQDLIN